MPLFVCDQCNAIENTALGAFWHRRVKGLPVLCSECSPRIEINHFGKGGKWHNRFPKVIATPEIIKEKGIDSFYYIPQKLLPKTD